MKYFIASLALLLLYSCSDTTEPTDKEPNYVYGTPSINSLHTALGVPVDNDSSDDYYIIRPQYVISYNKNRNVCNWVSWNLNAGWFGDVDRFEGSFKKDTALPSGWYQVKDGDYTNSGYDRGHIVRSEERTKTVEDNISTFYLTNILPQTPELNRGVWLDLEYLCEMYSKILNKELFVIAGGIFRTNKTLKDEGIVAIPDSCFKIIVVLDRGQGLKDVTLSTEVFAFVIPNTIDVSEDWQKYKTTVDRIENSTGYDFLNCLPKEIQNVLEK